MTVPCLGIQFNEAIKDDPDDIRHGWGFVSKDLVLNRNERFDYVI